MWPNTSNALKYMIAGKVPTSTWRCFPLVKEKIRSENREECEACNITTCTETEDEEMDISKRQRVRKRARVLDDFYLGDVTEKEASAPQTKTGLSRDPPNQRSQLLNLPSPPLKHRPRADRSPTPPRLMSPPNQPVSPVQSRERRVSPTGWSARLSPRRAPTVNQSKKMSPQRTGSFQMSTEVSPAQSSRRGSPPTLSPRWSPRRSSPPRPSPRLEETLARSSRKDGSSFPISEERFQRKVICLLAEIRMDIGELKQKVECGSSTLAEEGGIPLQTTTAEELEVLESSLSSSDEQKQLTRVLSRVGGNNAEECARRILTKLMTYDIMAGYSLKGRKGEKTFQNLKLFQVIVDAIVKTVRCTEVVAGAAISAVLKYAPDRRGGGGRVA